MSVVIVCGGREYRWHEAPPVFKTIVGSAVLHWEKDALIAHTSDLVPIYRYRLTSTVTSV